MSDWTATTKLLEGQAAGGVKIVEAADVPAVIEELKAFCDSRGVGGVFAVTSVEKYEVTIAASTAHAVRAAEVPEQVFIAGLKDSANLGIYVLDPANRWTPGDLATDSAWRCRQGITVELVNGATGATINDTFVSFDGSTGKLTYSGADTEQPRLYDVQLRINGALWPPFRIRIQRPTFTYGDATYADLTGITGVAHVPPANAGLGAALAQRFPATGTDNVVLLTPSTALADRYYVATINSFKDGLTSCYMIGVPGKTKIGGKGQKFTNCIVKRSATVYWKDLDIAYAWKLGSEDCTTHVVERVNLSNLNAADAIMFDNNTPWLPENTKQSAWVVNCEFTRCGQSGNKHPVYIHLRDTPLGSRSGGDATTHFNNVKSYGNNSAPMVNGVGPQGGCNLKCLSKYLTVRNCWLPTTDNAADPYNSWISSQVTSFHAHQRCVIYNNVFDTFNTTVQNFGQDKLLMFQNRNMADSGHDDPGYFNQDPGLPAIPPYQPRSCDFIADPATNLLKFVKKFSMMDAVTLTTTGTLPAPLRTGTTYYLMNQNNAGTRLSLTVNQQTSIDVTDAGSGTHTMNGLPTNLTFNVGYHGPNTYTADVKNAPFWAQVTAKPIADPTNPYTYYKYISFNTFKFTQITGDNQLVCAAVFDQGNPPCCPTRQFDPEQNYYSVPANWAERSQAWLANNTYEGFAGAGNKVQRWNGGTPPSIGVKYPYCVDPLKPRPDPVVVGGERNAGEAIADVQIPPWFLI